MFRPRCVNLLSSGQKFVQLTAAMTRWLKDIEASSSLWLIQSRRERPDNAVKASVDVKALVTCVVSDSVTYTEYRLTHVHLGSEEILNCPIRASQGNLHI